MVVVCKGPIFGDDQLLDDDFMIPRQRTITRLEGTEGEMALLVDGATSNPSGGLWIGRNHSTELDCPQPHRFSVRKADQTIDWIGCFLLGATPNHPSQGERCRKESRDRTERFRTRKLLQWIDSESVKDSGRCDPPEGRTGCLRVEGASDREVPMAQSNWIRSSFRLWRLASCPKVTVSVALERERIEPSA